MARSEADYLDMLQGLLPRGAAWSRDPEAVLTLLLSAWADELARVDQRGDDLADEADPRTTVEILAEWEAMAGLPEDCALPAQTLAERRDALVQKLTLVGGQSRQFFIDVAAAVGFQITIDEFRPFVAGSNTGDPLYDATWRFAWRVNGPQVTVRQFTAGSAAGEALRSWGNELLECVVGRLKPAHTTVQFAYGGT